MMSALECYLKAARCEEMARTCADPADRSMLLDTATIWRKLAAIRPARHGIMVPQAM